MSKIILPKVSGDSYENIPNNQSSKMPRPPQIQWIGELKGLSIILVVAFHMSSLIEPLSYIHGEVGVDVFLFLSGLGIALNLRPDEGALSFYARRFSNIVPAYWIVLIGVVLLNLLINYTEIDMANTIVHLLCLQAAGLENHFFFGLSMSFWFIGGISLLYVAVPFLKPLIISRQAVYIAAIGFFVPLAGLVYFKIFHSVGEHAGFMWTFLTRVPDFCIGIGAGIFFRNRGLTVTAMSVAVLVTMACLYLYLLPTGHIICFWYPALSVSICYLYVFLRKNVLKPVTSTLAFFGMISYELYLIHWTVFGFLSQWILHYITRLERYYPDSFRGLPTNEYLQRLSSGLGWIVLCIVGAYMLNRLVYRLRGIGLTTLLSSKRSFAIYTAGVIFTAFYFVRANWVNVPFGAQWTYYGISPLELISHGTYAGIFSNTVSFMSGLLTGFDTRAETAVAFAALCLILFNLYRLVRPTGGDSRIGLLFVFALVLFAPDMWKDIVAPRSFSAYLSILFLLAGLNINNSGLSFSMKVSISGLLALAGTLSNVDGALLWIFLFPFNMYFSLSAIERRALYPYVAAALITAAFCIKKSCFALWSLGYRFTVDRFIAALIPSGWSGMTFFERADILFIGICVLLLFILPLIQARRSTYFKDMYVWSVSGGFALIHIAIEPHEIYRNVLLISVIAGAFIFFTNADVEMKRWFSYCKAAAMTFFIIMFLGRCETAVGDMERQRFRLEAGRAALHLHEIIRDESKLKLLYPDTAFLLGRVKALERRLDKRPIDVINKTFRNTELWGEIDGCEFHDDKFKIRGWAINKITMKPATNVVINVIAEDGGTKLFGIVTPFLKRDDVNKYFNKKSLLNTGFIYSLNASALPSGRFIIIAFTTDVDRHVSHALRGYCSK